MNTRARWIVLGVALALVLGLVALYWFNTNLRAVTLEESNSRRTWIVRSGQTVTLSGDEIRPGDRIQCALKSDVPVIPGGGFQLDSSGPVAVTCEPRFTGF